MAFGAGYFQANWNVAPNESYLSFKELFMSSHEKQSAVEANETNPVDSTIVTQEQKPSKF